MKKRTVLAMVTALTIAASLFIGCGSKGDSGDTIPASNQTEEVAPALEKEESRKDDSEKKKAADATQKGVDAPKNEPTATPAEKTAAEPEKDTKTEPLAKPESNAAPEKPATNNNSGNAGNTKADPPAKEEQPNTPETPVHTHIWNEHTATRQEWVPNMVVVDDYETQTVVVGYAIQCNCGAVLSSEELEAHGANHILNGEPANHWTIEKTEQQQVKVGSHEEDHGHYETVSYVDYYYCDCGATK